MSIDPRLIERRKTVAEDKAKRNVSRLLKFLALVVVVGAGVWLAFSPWLSVSRVTTDGIATSDSHSVLAEAGVTAGTPMILINASEVEATLVDDPWVVQASVRLDWPDEVRVEVVERTPVAWVRTKGGWTRRAIDGVALPSAPEPGEGMARIDMPALTETEATESADLLGALEFVAALPRDLRQGTDITRRDGEIWATISGYPTRLGRSVDMTEKALSLDALLRKEIPEDSTLVLIAPTNPAVMAPSQEDEGAETDTEASNDDGEADETVADDTNQNP